MWGPPSSTASPRSRSWRAKGGTAPGPAPGGPNRRTCSPKSRSTSSRTTPSKCPGFPKTMPQTGAPKRDPRCLHPTGGEKPPGCPRRSPHPPSPLSSQVLGVGGAVLRRPHQRGGPSPGGAAQATRGRGRALQGEELQVPFPTPFIPHPLSCPLSSIISLARSPSSSSPPPQPPSPVAGGAASPVLSVPPACPCRSRPWGSTTRSAGPRRTCWRSRRTEPGLQPLPTRRKASWGRSPSWTPKVPSSHLAQRAGGCGERFGGLAPSFCRARAASAPLLIIFFPPADVDALLKKSEAQHEQPEDGCPFGPLTQRLLQALVEVRGLGAAVVPRGCGRASCDPPLLAPRSPGEHHLPRGGLPHPRDRRQGLGS